MTRAFATTAVLVVLLAGALWPQASQQGAKTAPPDAKAPSAAAPSDEPDAAQAAMKHMEANRFKEAIELLKPHVAAHPEDYPARFNLALAYSLVGNDTEAIVEYGKVVEQKPDLFEAQMNLGQLLVKISRFADAEASLLKAIELKPNDSRPVFLLSRAYSGQKKWTEAASRMKAAGSLSPGDNEMKLELADLYEKAGMKAEAIEAWKAVGDNPAALERLGLLQLDAQDYEGAIATFESAMKKERTTAVMYALATAYLRNKQPDKSIPLAQQIVEREPLNTAARMFLARLLRDKLDYASAARQFQQVLRQKPDSLEAWNEFTAVLMLLGQYETALQALERVRALGGENAAYFYLKAVMLDALKQAKPALESYERFLELSVDKSPEEEFKARQRVRILKNMVKR